jgi:phosphotransferase family enzyme
VWRNEVGGLTFRLGDGAGRRFVKWQPAGRGVDLAGEAERLAWAGRFTPVPAVLGRGDDKHGSWLLTAGLPGENAVGPRWLADPGPAVAAIGHGLRAWHDALPISGCPFRWAPDDGRPAPAVPERDLVVCHGDACAPNTLVDQPRPVVGSRRRRRAWGGRPLGGPGDRHLEHRVELRSGLGRTAARRLRRRPGPGSHPPLPRPVGQRALRLSGPAVADQPVRTARCGTAPRSTRRAVSRSWMPSADRWLRS